MSQFYIALDKTNTFHYGNSYLINIPLNQVRGNLLIKDSTKTIPLIAYSGLFHDRDKYGAYKFSLNSIVVVHPTMTKIPVKQRATAINNQNFIGYNIKYYPEGAIDTLNGIDAKLAHYKPLLEANELKKDSLLIYYSEFRGSGCCPGDITYNNKITLTDFISAFEKTHQVKIGNLFYISMGKEGEYGVYLTLSGLTSEQKIRFIDERIKTLFFKSHQSVIYTPYWEAINYLVPPPRKLEIMKEPKVDTSAVFTAVDLYPTPIENIDSFKMRFKDVHFVETPPVITFIVKRDGSLTDVKVSRDGNKEIEKQVIKIIKKSPKWIPGKENGIFVKVEYVMALTTQPRPNENIDSFKMRFKNVRFTTSRTFQSPVITFDVKKDGSIINIEVARGGNEEIKKQVINIINRSPKWIPGKCNNVPVDDHYELSIDID